MDRYGLIGAKLQHSFSPFIHGEIFKNSGVEGEYSLFEVEEKNLQEKLRWFLKSGYKGINVTIPYKEVIIKHLDYISPEAMDIGAVNTIKFEDGKIKGYNTDYKGVEETFKNQGIKVKGKKVLILGTGGASKSCVTCAKVLGAEKIVCISRSIKNLQDDSVDVYDNLSRYKDFSLVMNATPTGMFPDVDESPLRVDYIQNREFVFDLIYNPLRTKLIQQCEDKNIKAVNGLHMLILQAVSAQEIWNDTVYPGDIKKTILESCIAEKTKNRNVVLVGMPGSGKTTIGRELSKILELNFIDCDMEIIDEQGMSIVDIFKKGELYFRDAEEEVIKRVSRLDRNVISTGGGCVLRDDNIHRLKNNSVIIMIDRDVSKIHEIISADKSRPLVKSEEQLNALYRERIERYKLSADYIVENNETIEKTVERIVCIINKACLNK